MSALLSKTAEYGVRAVLYIASHPNERIKTKEIAKSLRIPYHFLAKVIQKLVKAKIIHSKRGLGGGFVLKKSPDKVKLIDIVIALDGDEIFKKCALGLPNCSDERPCAVHKYWQRIRGDIQKMLSEESVAELINQGFKI